MVYPEVWGNQAWFLLHVQAHLYPHEPTDSQKEAMESYLRSFFLHLPCPGCSYHAIAYLNEHPLQNQSKTDLKNYIYKFHNAVNERLKKPVLSLKQADARFKYNFRNQYKLALSRNHNAKPEEENTKHEDSEGPTETGKGATSSILLLILFALVCFAMLMKCWFTKNSPK